MKVLTLRSNSGKGTLTALAVSVTRDNIREVGLWMESFGFTASWQPSSKRGFSFSAPAFNNRSEKWYSAEFYAVPGNEIVVVPYLLGSGQGPIAFLYERGELQRSFWRVEGTLREDEENIARAAS